jgi:LysR family hydrogen peroxide-inducible transcriptional activator
VVNLCETKTQQHKSLKFQYETGSLETIMKIVEKQHGFTLLPYLSTIDMNAERKALVKEFVSPQPKREVSIIFHRGHLKRKLIERLKIEIMAHIPAYLKEKKDGYVVSWV